MSDIPICVFIRFCKYLKALQKEERDVISNGSRKGRNKLRDLPDYVSSEFQGFDDEKQVEICVQKARRKPALKYWKRYTNVKNAYQVLHDGG